MLLRLPATQRLTPQQQQAETQPDLATHLQRALRRAIVNQNLDAPIDNNERSAGVPASRSDHSARPNGSVYSAHQSGRVRALSDQQHHHDVGAMESGGAGGVSRVQAWTGGGGGNGGGGSKVVPAG